jgi:hypothetical protein
MLRWQDQLAALVRLAPTLRPPSDPQWPVVSEWFRISPPSGRAWPEGCPCCPALRDFYAICDGARFPRFDRHYTDWLPLAELRPRTQEVVERFRQWYLDDGWDDMPRLGRHLVFARGSNDCCAIWDSSTDKVFGHDGLDENDWNEQDETVEELLQAALLPQLYPREYARHRLPVMEWWLDTLHQLQRLADPGATADGGRDAGFSE